MDDHKNEHFDSLKSSKKAMKQVVNDENSSQVGGASLLFSGIEGQKLKKALYHLQLTQKYMKEVDSVAKRLGKSRGATLDMILKDVFENQGRGLFSPQTN